MTNIKYKRNSGFAEPWAQPIGKFILNFGLLEFESHMWLLQMSDEPQLFPDMWFIQRVTQIRKLVDQHAFDEVWKASARLLWENAQALAETRNQLAHNPLMFSWTDPAEEGPPDLIGILNAKSFGDGNSAWESTIRLTDIAEKGNKVATLVEKLTALRETWCSLRDQGVTCERP